MTAWRLEIKTIPKGTWLDDFNRGVRARHRVDEDTEVEVLMKGEEIWMSNTEMEKNTNNNFIKVARGDVLIAGLGMGWVVQEIMNDPKVNTITVVEIDNDLINFITSKKEFNHKVTIINDNIWNFLDSTRRDTKRFDVIWLDIWKDICPDNLVEMYPMRYLARKILRKEGDVFVWTMEISECMTHLAFGGGNIEEDRCITEELKRRGIEK